MCNFCVKLPDKYMATGVVVLGTIIDVVVKMGVSPVKAAFTNVSNKGNEDGEDGVVDSLKYLLLHENFIKPWSQEHVLATFE